MDPIDEEERAEEEEVGQGLMEKMVAQERETWEEEKESPPSHFIQSGQLSHLCHFKFF